MDCDMATLPFYLSPFLSSAPPSSPPLSSPLPSPSQQPHSQVVTPPGQGEGSRKRSREDPAEDSEGESVELKVDDEDESLPPSPAASSGGQPSRHKVDRPGTPSSSRSGGSSSVSGGEEGDGRGEGGLANLCPCTRWAPPPYRIPLHS